MTLLRSTAPATSDAIRLLSAIGDAFGNHAAGFALRVARVAARFAVHRGCDHEMVAATYFAAALHEIGLIRVVVPPGTSERERTIALWDAPAQGATIADGIGGLPHATGDYIRWHRESFDGTGFPDRLRWNGIPHASMAINVARAFVEAIEAQGEDASPPEAMFALVGEAGRAYAVNVIREFREFYSALGADFDAAFDPAWPLDRLDPKTLVTGICAEIDARDERTLGRGERLEALTLAIAEKLEGMPLESEAARFAARLVSLGRIRREGTSDDFDPLARLGREARAAEAISAAHLLEHAPAFAAYGTIVGASAEWFDGSGLPRHLSADGIDPIARVLAFAIAAEAMGPALQAPLRLQAAAGTQFDPAVVRAYLATTGGQR